MEKKRGNFKSETVSSGGLSMRHMAVIVIVALAVLILIFYLFSWRGGKEGEPGEAGVTRVPEGRKAVTLFFAREDEEGLIGETRQVAIEEDFADEVKQTIQALLDGPEHGGVSAIPQGTEIIDVFYDSEKATLFLDFSSELVGGHPGGSAAEYYTIASIMRTVSENFPRVRAVQILVEGLQMGTIGGHIDASRPLLVSEWR